MSEFDLSLANQACDKIICVYPAVSKKSDKLFVQVGLSTGETVSSFERRPLNVSLVLDISGSMGATDNTHQDRLEWAKEALVASVNQLNANDIVSIVLFNSDSKILLPPTKASDKSAIYNLISGIKAEGSTNLESGLRDGYNLVSQHIDDNFENRVILISDAGLNTGVISTAELVRLVSDNAANKIGLTAIGMGDNFNEEFIHGISQSRGGNYLFVQSGAGLSSYFDQFKYLVTPVAYSFKASLRFNGVDAKLVKSYGIPQTASAPVTEIFDVQTLFLTSGGGGAIVLEYDLQPDLH